jgi:hypothetical protein
MDRDDLTLSSCDDCRVVDKTDTDGDKDENKMEDRRG